MKKIAIFGSALLALAFSVSPSAAHWRRGWCHNQYCRAPLVYVTAPWDVPYYRRSPYSVVNGVLVPIPYVVGPIKKVLVWTH